jgi:hypothetical protein
MNNEGYGIYEVLIGMFDKFKVENRRYNHNKDKFDRFFHENKPKYSVLDKLNLNNGELEETHVRLVKGRFLTIYNIKPAFNYPESNLLTFSFLFHKNKFNECELNELEQLSLEFQKEFCE